LGARSVPYLPPAPLRCGTLVADPVHDELFGLNHRAFRHLDVGHGLSEEAAHAPASLTHEVGVVSRAAFPGEDVGAISPHPVGSLYRMYDCPALQGEEGSIERDPIESSYFFPPPEIGVGNRAAELQQVPQDCSSHRGNPQGNASQEGAGGCLVFRHAHRCTDIECNYVALIIIYMGKNYNIF
jgi:hypothetical protein